MNREIIVCFIPPHHDFLTEMILDGLVQLDLQLFISSIITSLFRKACEESDRIFVFSNTGSQDRVNFILENGYESKTYYIDGDDSTRLEYTDAPEKFCGCFKRELLTYDPQSNVRPLPFCAERIFYQSRNLEKNIPFSCIMNQGTNPIRGDIIERLLSLKYPGSIIGQHGLANALTPSTSPVKDDYYKLLAQSKISISYYGSGYDTARFWEILGSGAVLFSPPIKNVMLHPFVEDVHFIVYHSIDELIERLITSLEHIKTMEVIQKQGYQHMYLYHTSKARALYLLSEVGIK